MSEQRTINPGVRFIPESPTNEQAERCRRSALYNHGDCVLVWVNQGDIIRNGVEVEWVKGQGFSDG